MDARHLAVALSVTILLTSTLVPSGCAKRGTPNETALSPSAAQVPDTAPQPAPLARRLVVFAGAAGKPALQDLVTSYEATAGVQVDITYGGSGALLTQFSQEQYGDVYIPGSDDFMEKAEGKRAVRPETRTVLAYLVPTICVAKGNPKGIRDLNDLARDDVRVVLAQPEAVCLGDIAQAMLTETGLWDKVKPRVASYAGSCEDTLNNLLLGEADVIIGWDVFARQQPDAVDAIELRRELARPRNIPAAVIEWSKQPDAAKAFIAFLASDKGRKVFGQTGYTVDWEEQRPT